MFSTYKLKKNIRLIVAVVLVLIAINSYFGRDKTDSAQTALVSASESSLSTESSSQTQPSSQQSESSKTSSHESKGKLHHWGNPNTLQDHFDRHGRDFDATDPEDYARQANEFYNNRDNYSVKIDDDGVFRIYDSESNSFGAYNENGSTRSFFKPSDSRDYFDRQPGKLQ